jgi:hypothetical protein
MRTISIFLDRYGRSSMRFSVLNFMKIGRVETILYVRSRMKFRPIFYTFGVMWIKFCRGDIHRTSSSICEFPAVQRIKSLRRGLDFLPKSVTCFLPLDEILVNQHKIMLSVSEFHENPSRRAIRFLWAPTKSHLSVWLEPCDTLQLINVVVKSVLRHRVHSLWFY